MSDVHDDEITTESEEAGGESGPPSVDSPPIPEPHEPPKPAMGDDLRDLVGVLKEQNQVNKEQNELLKENIKLTKELHEVVFSEDDNGEESEADPAKTKPTVVEPEPPPQPHQPLDENPRAPEKTGWRRLY